MFHLSIKHANLWPLAPLVESCSMLKKILFLFLSFMVLSKSYSAEDTFPPWIKGEATTDVKYVVELKSSDQPQNFSAKIYDSEGMGRTMELSYKQLAKSQTWSLTLSSLKLSFLKGCDEHTLLFNDHGYLQKINDKKDGTIKIEAREQKCQAEAYFNLSLGYLSCPKGTTLGERKRSLKLSEIDGCGPGKFEKVVTIGNSDLGKYSNGMLAHLAYALDQKLDKG